MQNMPNRPANANIPTTCTPSDDCKTLRVEKMPPMPPAGGKPGGISGMKK